MTTTPNKRRAGRPRKTISPDPAAREILAAADAQHIPINRLADMIGIPPTKLYYMLINPPPTYQKYLATLAQCRIALGIK